MKYRKKFLRLLRKGKEKGKFYCFYRKYIYHVWCEVEELIPWCRQEEITSADLEYTSRCIIIQQIFNSDSVSQKGKKREKLTNLKFHEWSIKITKYFIFYFLCIYMPIKCVVSFCHILFILTFTFLFTYFYCYTIK